MKKTLLLALLIGILLLVMSCSSSDEDAAKPEITIYKSSSCGCCGLYGNYIKKDFTVKIMDLPDLTPIKSKYAVPSSLQSCHTSIVEGYFVEGHVPKEAIQKLLAERPDIKGIALPGMPSGSPGMSGSKEGSWTIYAVGNDGRVTEFMKI